MRLVSALLILALTPGLAYAHAGHLPTDGFAYGFGHPLGGIDHVLAMVAVGLFAFVLGGRALWALPLAFLAMMAVGFLLGAAELRLPLVEVGIAASSIAFGAIIAAGRRLPVATAVALVGAFSVFHGHAHGTEMPAGAGGLTYALGFIAATALLHLAGIAGSLGFTMALGAHGRLAARLTGGLFALGGVGMLAGWI
jgi:urease accessory protein